MKKDTAFLEPWRCCTCWGPAGRSLELAPLPERDGAETADRFYQNPLGVENIGDPFILPAQGAYYAFATGSPVGFYTWSSQDMKTFGGRKKALQRVSWATGDYWAPEVYAYQGRYVMVFSARRIRTRACGWASPCGGPQAPTGTPGRPC